MPNPIPLVAPAKAPEADASAGRLTRVQGAAPALTPEAVARLAARFADIIEQLCLLLAAQIDSAPLPSRLAARLTVLTRHGLHGIAARFAALATLAATPLAPARPCPAPPAPAPTRNRARPAPPPRRSLLQRWLPAWLRRREQAPHRAPATRPRRPRAAGAGSSKPRPSPRRPAVPSAPMLPSAPPDPQPPARPATAPPTAACNPRRADLPCQVPRRPPRPGTRENPAILRTG